MIKMSIINRKELKKMFESKGIKIGTDASKAFSEKQREILEMEVEKVTRNARIAGRKAKIRGSKVIKKKDFA